MRAFLFGKTMSEEIGRGVIRIEGDASELKTEINSAKRSIKDLGDASNKAAGSSGKIGDGADRSDKKIARATSNMISSIQRTTAAMDAGSRSSSKYYEVIAQQRGVDVGALKPYLDQLDAVNAKQNIATAALNAGSKANVYAGLSAKQMAFSLRGVPAQFTDIAVSLQSGQRPLQVLLQQGGQLKDMFGGIGPAAKALGGYVLGLINPFTIAAAAVGTLGLAYFQGSKETDAYNKALIITGNISGTTANKLEAMAHSIDKSSNATQGAAAEALAELAGTGEIAAVNLERFASVAVSLNKRVGIPIKDTAKDLAELGKSPLEASEKLNDKYHYLTASVYEQIKALEDQGRAEEAASLAQNSYANALASRADEIKGNLGYVERAWEGAKNAAKEAWDEFLGLGRKSTLQDRLAGVTSELAKYGNRNFPSERVGSSKYKSLTAQQAALQAEIDAEGKLATAKTATLKKDQARIGFLKDGEKYLSRQAQMEREIVAARAKGKLGGFSDKEIDSRVGDIKAKYAIKAKKPKVDREQERIAAAQLTFDLDQIRKSSDEITNTYSNAEKIMSAKRAAGLIDEREYYAAKLGFLNLNSQAQASSIQQEIDRLNQEKLSGKEKIDNTRKIADAQARLDKVQADSAANAVVLSTQQIGANKRIADSYEDARKAAEAYIETVNKQNAREIAGIGRGSKYRQEQSGRNAIEDKQTKQRQVLEGDLRRGDIDREQFDAYLAIVNKTYADEISAYEARTATMNEMQGNWANGAAEAMQNYYDKTKDIAGQVEEAFTKAFQGMEDAIVEFTMTGKLDFKSFARSIISDIVRINTRKMISGWMESAKGSSGSFLSAIGSIFGAGKATGGPVSAGMLYPVNEKGPELLSTGGKSYLMMGSQDGKITPNNQLGSGGNTIVVNVNGSNNAPEVRRAAGQGAREALGMFSGAKRYA